jgi:HK97 family phage portal protein
MGLFQDIKNRIFASTEQRTSLESPQTPLSFPAEWLLDIFNGGRTDSGLRVSELTALQSVAVRSCAEIIGNGVATQQMFVYEETPTKNGRMNRREAREHDLWPILRNCPNDEMNAKVFWAALTIHAVLWSNAYAEIQRDKAGRPVMLWLRQPHKTMPERVTAKEGMTLADGTHLAWGELVYSTTDGIYQPDLSENGAESYRAKRYIVKEDIIHLKGLSLDGWIGSSAIQDARQTVGLALALEKYGAKFFGNGARASVIIEVPGNVTDAQKDLLRKSFQEAQGGENMLRPLVLTQGMKATPMALKNDEAQFKETRQLQTTEICALFHVPPHMLGQMEKSNRSNLEQVSMEFVSYCLGPWLVQLKQELENKLLGKPSGVGRPGKNYVIDYNPPIKLLTDLFRPASEEREKSYQTGFATGSLSPNDIRVMEGMNPSDDEGMDDYYIGVNIQKVSDPVVTSEPEPGGGGNSPASEPATPAKNPRSAELKIAHRIYSGLFTDAFNRVSARSKPDSAAFERTFLPVFMAIADHLGTLGERQTSVDTKFVKDYIGGMFKRHSKTPLEPKDELNRAIRALWLSVNRAAAETQALRDLEQEDCNDGDHDWMTSKSSAN